VPDSVSAQKNLAASSVNETLSTYSQSVRGLRAVIDQDLRQKWRDRKSLIEDARSNMAKSVRQGSVIMVTSSVPAEGKSTLSLSLARVKIIIERSESINLRSLCFGGALLTLASFSLLAFESSKKWLLENVLFADDQLRGASSGFLSGRDVRWQDAWNSFIDRPFFGHGLNWYIDGISLGAHSPFLYSLVYFGIFGLTFWIFFLVRFFVIAKYNLHIAVLLLPCFLMFVLNDRFLNSNAFPLLLYFIVIRLSQFRSKFTLQLHQSLGSRPHTRANPWRISQ
jgi:hypothetical protein